jgi:hypothetical protein
MIKIIYFLFLVRFRKLVTAGDAFAVLLIVVLYCSCAIIIYKNYDALNYYLYLFFIDIYVQHTNRNDLELLKLNPKYKTIIFIQYVFYLLPIYVVFLLKNDFFFIIGLIIFKLILINIPKLKFITIQYPFQLFNPFWHICFRKYKLLFFLPVILFLVFISFEYDNQNIIYFAFFILTLISCIPSFERERLEEIKYTKLDSKSYLFYQIKNSIINTIYLILPIAITLCFLSRWTLLCFLLGTLFIPLINIFLKYNFFYNSFLHQISFVVFSCLIISLFGAPLLLVPYLYKKSIKNLNIIRYANH